MANSSKGCSLGIGTILTIIFLILKLLNVTNMSWFWVFFPIGLMTLLYAVALILIVIAAKKNK